MKNNTYIVLLEVANNPDGRIQLERIENEVFQCKPQAENKLKEMGCENFELCSISDFMDLCNNEEFYPINYWLGYINIM